MVRFLEVPYSANSTEGTNKAHVAFEKLFKAQVHALQQTYFTHTQTHLITHLHTHTHACKAGMGEPQWKL